MTPLLELIVYFTIFTFFTVLLCAFLRNKEWTPEGLKTGLSNRQAVPEATPLGGRAERTANNSIEAAVFFTPLALTAQLAGLHQEVMLGAHVFALSRLVYVPVYLVGVPVLRSLIWGVGIIGLGMMIYQML